MHGQHDQQGSRPVGRALQQNHSRAVARALSNNHSRPWPAGWLKMSQEQLAHRCAGTRQSVNAALRGFERRGWIEAHDRAVTVKQAAALGRFAEI